MKWYTLSALILTLIVANIAFAQGVVTVEPLTNIGVQDAGVEGIAGFINTLYRYLIGIGAILAVLVIMYGGFRYMTSEAIGQKSAGREEIQRAVIGLLLLLSPVIVFGVINQDITNLRFDLTRLNSEQYTGGNATTTPNGECRVFPAGNTLITDSADRQCCTEQTRPSCDVVTDGDRIVCNCYGQISYKYISELPVTDAGGNTTGEMCRSEEQTGRHNSLAACQRAESAHQNGTNVVTKSCLDEDFNPPRPAATWERLQGLPACSETVSEEQVYRKWVGRLEIQYIPTGSQTAQYAYYPGRTETVEVSPDPSGSISEQEAECERLTTPEALLSRFNTPDVRATIGAESIISMAKFGTTRSCSDET